MTENHLSDESRDPQNHPSSYAHSHSGNSGFVYDSQASDPSEAEYVPEREFVLMPFFRRIGDLFRGKQHAEADREFEHVAEEPARVESGTPVEPVASYWQQHERALPQETAAAEASAHLQPFSETSLYQAETDATRVEARHFEEPTPVATSSEVPEVSLVTPSVAEAAVEAPVQHFEAAQPIQVEEPQAHAAEPAQTVDFEAQEAAPEPQVVATTTAEPLAAPKRPILVPDVRRAQQNSDLLAPLRDAAAKISVTISQAADWLHQREEEILKRAELPVTPAAAQEHAPAVEAIPPAYDSVLDSSTVTAHPTESIHVEQWDGAATPAALQRELAWRSAQSPTPDHEAPPLAIPTKAAAVDSRSNTVVLPPKTAKASRWRPINWKGIDWNRQFTPRRVALLGGVVMAALMIAGISLARHPASDALPKQARSLEAGGVTLTATPGRVAAAVAKPNTVQPSPTHEAQKPMARHRVRTHAAVDDGGPEVVTHYYGNKPSPVHQSTVAGVRHYSDMQ